MLVIDILGHDSIPLDGVLSFGRLPEAGKASSIAPGDADLDIDLSSLAIVAKEGGGALVVFDGPLWLLVDVRSGVAVLCRKGSNLGLVRLALSRLPEGARAAAAGEGPVLFPTPRERRLWRLLTVLERTELPRLLSVKSDDGRKWQMTVVRGKVIAATADPNTVWQEIAGAADQGLAYCIAPAAAEQEDGLGALDLAAALSFGDLELRPRTQAPGDGWRRFSPAGWPSIRVDCDDWGDVVAAARLGSLISRIRRGIRRLAALPPDPEGEFSVETIASGGARWPVVVGHRDGSFDCSPTVLDSPTKMVSR